MKNENEKRGKEIEGKEHLSWEAAVISDGKLIMYSWKFVVLFWVGGWE